MTEFQICDVLGREEISLDEDSEELDDEPEGSDNTSITIISE
jgi:hypothetical protein